MSSPISSPAPPLPRRSTRGKPPERYGKVYTFDTLVDIGPNFKCPCDYCTYNLLIYYYLLAPLTFIIFPLRCVED